MLGGMGKSISSQKLHNRYHRRDLARPEDEHPLDDVRFGICDILLHLSAQRCNFLRGRYPKLRHRALQSTYIVLRRKNILLAIEELFDLRVEEPHKIFRAPFTQRFPERLENFYVNG